MKTQIILVAVAAALGLACHDAQAPVDTGTFTCTAPAGTVVFNGLDAYDALAVQGGFVYVEIPGQGVQRCPTTGCETPTVVATTPAFVSAALGATGISYTTQIASPAGGIGGEIRSVNVDGSGDQSVLGSLTYPAYVATSGGLTFWAEDSFASDDTPAVIHCIGCGGSASSTPWMAGIGGGTYGMMADTNNVYVLADDASLTTVSLLSCGTQTPCFSEPRVVVGGLDRTVTAQQIASDGTYVYAVYAPDHDIVRVDSSGGVTTVIRTSEVVTAIAVDVASGELYYGTADGSVQRVKSDGSDAQPSMLACSGTQIAALAIDGTSLYMLAGASSSDVLKVAK